MNRILVTGDDRFINQQARTYAEYRLFSALTRHGLDFRRARIALRQRDDPRTCDKVACAVTVALEPSGFVRIRVVGPHIYAAINRAVERLAKRLARESSTVVRPDRRALTPVRGAGAVR